MNGKAVLLWNIANSVVGIAQCSHGFTHGGFTAYGDFYSTDNEGARRNIFATPTIEYIKGVVAAYWRI